jgi:hypothetical protein
MCPDTDDGSRGQCADGDGEDRNLLCRSTKLPIPVDRESPGGSPGRLLAGRRRLNERDCWSGAGPRSAWRRKWGMAPRQGAGVYARSLALHPETEGVRSPSSRAADWPKLGRGRGWPLTSGTEAASTSAQHPGIPSAVASVARALIELALRTLHWRYSDTALFVRLPAVVACVVVYRSSPRPASLHLVSGRIAGRQSRPLLELTWRLPRSTAVVGPELS